MKFAVSGGNFVGYNIREGLPPLHNEIPLGSKVGGEGIHTKEQLFVRLERFVIA